MEPRPRGFYVLAGFFTLWPLDLTDGKRVVPGGEAMDVMTDERLRAYAADMGYIRAGPHPNA